MKEFVMGARLQMRDQFSQPISQASKATRSFKSTVDQANRSTKTWTDSHGRLRNAQGQYVKGMQKANAVTRTYIDSNGQLRSSLGFVQRGLAGVATYFGIMKAKSWLVDGNADMETYKNTLKVVLKDEQKAVDTLAWATKFAAQTPFEIPQIVEATTRMSAYGINAQKTLGIVGDMAAVMGKDLMQAVEAVADAQTGELERLKEFGITKKMIDDQAKLMHATVTNNQGQITDQKAFNAALFALMDKRYKGGMKMQSGTFKGMISNAKDFMGSMGREIGKPIFIALNAQLYKLLKIFNDMQQSGKLAQIITQIQTAIMGIGRAIVFIWPYLTTWGPIILGLVAAYSAYHKTIAIVTAVTKAWATIQAILNGTLVLNPIGLVVAGIVALIAIVVVLVTHWKQVTAAVKNAWNWFTNLIKGMPDVALALTGPLAPILLLIKHFKEVKDAVGGAFTAVKKFFGFGDGNKATTPDVGHNALGTKSWRGGPTWVGEHGPEIIDAPRRSAIYNNRESRAMVKPTSSKVRPAASGGRLINIEKLVEKIVIEGYNGDTDELLNKLIARLKQLMEEADDILSGGDMEGLLYE